MQLLSTEETARRLGVHVETVRRLLRSGTLRGVKIGHVHRIEEGEISAYVERLRAGAALGNEVSREEAKAKGFGFLKGRIGSSDDFLEAKHAEARAELERDEQRRAHSSGTLERREGNPQEVAA
jgi:excisionase family DNA binding protein